MCLPILVAVSVMDGYAKVELIVGKSLLHRPYCVRKMEWKPSYCVFIVHEQFSKNYQVEFMRTYWVGMKWLVGF